MAPEMYRDMRARMMCASTLLFAFSAFGAPGGEARAAAAGGPGLHPPEDPFRLRPLPLEAQGRWLGDGIAYGPHRDGQFPGGPSPSREEIREDLRLIAGRWRLLRIYGAGEPARTILDVIREEGLDLKVMLGIWIAPESSQAGAAEANRREIEAGIQLAGAYPEIAVAVCVGNETQVSWSDHRVPADFLLACLREVRARTQLPVTTADDFGWWRGPESRAVAAEVDFLTVHAHPLWNGIQLEAALDWTREVVAAIGSAHPDRPLVLGETGWATASSPVGEQARLIKGKPGEEEQAVFHREVTAWARGERLPLFFFEAFDENWKGGDRADEVEKHWGLYRSDRTPKEALRDGS